MSRTPSELQNSWCRMQCREHNTELQYSLYLQLHPWCQTHTLQTHTMTIRNSWAVTWWLTEQTDEPLWHAYTSRSIMCVCGGVWWCVVVWFNLKIYNMKSTKFPVKIHICHIHLLTLNTNRNNFLKHLRVSTRYEISRILHTERYFNADLLKYNKHNHTSDFINTMFSLSYIPLINRPTRVTEHSASIIDNIFTNHHKTTNYMAGIIPTDVSDHFSIFHIIYNDVKSQIPKAQYKQQRIMNDASIANCVSLLRNISWENVLYKGHIK